MPQLVDSHRSFEERAAALAGLQPQPCLLKFSQSSSGEGELRRACCIASAFHHSPEPFHFETGWQFIYNALQQPGYALAPRECPVEVQAIWQRSTSDQGQGPGRRLCLRGRQAVPL